MLEPEQNSVERSGREGQLDIGARRRIPPCCVLPCREVLWLGPAASTCFSVWAGVGAAAGGGSTTLANSTGSPVGATASMGAVLKASMGADASSIGVSRTGWLVSLASSRALDFAYTNSSPHSRPG